MWAAELVHKASDDTVEMKPIVKARSREVDEVGRTERYTVEVNFGLEVALVRLEERHGIRHCHVAWSGDIPISWDSALGPKTLEPLSPPCTMK